MNRGSFSFVAMLVVNPVLIIFFQNCSMSPISYAQNKTPGVVSRQVASEAKPVVADVKKESCAEGEKPCHQTE